MVALRVKETVGIRDYAAGCQRDGITQALACVGDREIGNQMLADIGVRGWYVLQNLGGGGYVNRFRSSRKRERRFNLNRHLRAHVELLRVRLKSGCGDLQAVGVHRNIVEAESAVSTRLDGLLVICDGVTQSNF